jgi:CheY-like chemotaxis protein
MVARTVLIVEDEEDLRASLQDALEDEGYSVVLASNGKEALELLPQLRRPCALVLDIIMPVLSGRELYQTMRADGRFSDIPVLVSTSDPSRAPPGALIMKKPIDLGRLLAVVESFFPRENPPSGGDGGLGQRSPSKPHPDDGSSAAGGARSARPERLCLPAATA